MMAGPSLDHVYRNRGEGTTPLGRWIDRGYLDAVGWQGIRQRKRHLEAALDEAIVAAARNDVEVTILDVAAGPGRYLLETLRRHRDLPVRAILCDRDEAGLAEGRALAEELAVSSQVEFRRSDAFDPQAVAAAINGRPIQIAIVSGLFELFPDNAPVRRTLKALAEGLAEEGRLLITNQPWHPQQEMIARVLPNREGVRWRMRCRGQAELTALLAEVGLLPDRTRIDRWGIFSVTTAGRRTG